MNATPLDLSGLLSAISALATAPGTPVAACGEKVPAAFAEVLAALVPASAPAAEQTPVPVPTTPASEIPVQAVAPDATPTTTPVAATVSTQVTPPVAPELPAMVTPPAPEPAAAAAMTAPAPPPVAHPIPTQQDPVPSPVFEADAPVTEAAVEEKPALPKQRHEDNEEARVEVSTDTPATAPTVVVPLVEVVVAPVQLPSAPPVSPSAPSSKKAVPEPAASAATAAPQAVPIAGPAPAPAPSPRREAHVTHLSRSEGAENAILGGSQPVTDVMPKAQAAPIRTSSERVVDQVMPVVTELAKGLRRTSDLTTRLVVRLHPQELGSVTVALRATATGVDVTVRASATDSATALVGQEQRIRDVLSTNGLDLSSYTVTADAGSSGGSQSRREPTQQPDTPNLTWTTTQPEVRAQQQAPVRDDSKYL